MRHNSPHLLSCIPGHRFCPRARLGARLLDTDGSCPAEDPPGATCHARQASWPEQDRDSSPGFGCREPPPPAGRPESRLPFLPERCRLHCNHTIMMPLKCHIWRNPYKQSINNRLKIVVFTTNDLLSLHTLLSRHPNSAAAFPSLTFRGRPGGTVVSAAW